MAVCGKCQREAPPGAVFCAFCATPIATAAPGSPPPDPYIGKTFRGTYFVQRKLGEGGMGVVYQAQHVALELPVALKILRGALLADPSVVQRFQREARAASRLRHPNVVAVTDFGQAEDGTLFMVMEYVAGRSLARVIAEEAPLAEARAVRIGAQMLAALEEAHAGQVLHRDLKPDNVMLDVRRDEPEAVKVLDFGIAKIQLPGDAPGTLTQAGLVCGTPGYMSPEQWGGEPLDVRSDLYAAGVCLYEMLTGKLPLEAHTPMEMLRRHLTEKPAPPSERRPDRTYSPSLEALVMRAISADRNERPESAAAMRAELLACPLLDASSAEPPPAARTVVLAAVPSSPSTPARAAPGTAAPAFPRTLSDAGTAAAPLPPPASPGPTPGAPARATPRPPARVSPPPRPARRPSGDAPAAPRPGPRPERRAEASPVRRRGMAIAGGALAAVAVVAGVALALRKPPPPPPRPPDPVVRPDPPPVVPPRPLLPSLAALEPASGRAAGGERLTLRGSGFAPGARVTFGALPAVVRATLPEALEVESPPHAPGAVEVAVENPDGGRAFLPAAYRYVEDPAPPPPPRPRPPVERPRLVVRDALNAIATPAAATGQGVLSVQAEPFGEVYLDGRHYGTAPREFRIAAGRYLVRVAHPELGKLERRLEVRAGERARWVADFLSR